MADISEYIDAINTAVRGEDVRDAIISAIELINQNRNAYTLNGHRAEYFAKSEDLEKIYPLDETPVEGSTKGVTSGGLYSYIWDKIGGTLNRIIGEESGDSITDRLQTLVDIKKEIKQAIKFRGTDPEEAPFTEYADLIKNLSGVDVSVSTLSISSPEKKEYEAGEKKAYDKVSVNITYTEGTDTLTKGIIGNSLDPETYSKEFDIKQDPDYQSAPDNRKPIGYSKVTVDVSDKIAVMSEPINIDPNDFGLSQTYKASDDALFGYSEFTINIVESQGPFNVTFYSDMDKSKMMSKVTGVPVHGDAFYDGPDPNSSTYCPKGKMFKEWNPKPFDIIRDTNCFAVYVDKPSTEPEGAISDTWSDIAKNGGKGIAIGAWKLLTVDLSLITYNGQSLGEGESDILMQKVAEGECGTGSTWIARSPLIINQPMYVNDWTSQNSDADGYEHSDLRYMLNNSLLSAINSAAAQDSDGADDFSHYITPIAKNFLGYSNKSGLKYGENKNIKIRTLTSEYVWLMSAYELGLGTGINYSGEKCPKGSFKSIRGDGQYTYVKADGSYPDLIDCPGDYEALVTNETWLRSASRTDTNHKYFIQDNDNYWTLYDRQYVVVSMLKEQYSPPPSLSDNKCLGEHFYMHAVNERNGLDSARAYFYLDKDMKDKPFAGSVRISYFEPPVVKRAIRFGFCLSNK